MEQGICIQTVSKRWRRYAASGPDGLLDEARPGQPRKLSDASIERVIVRTLESKPDGATHWSTRSMAQATGLNQTAISRIWRVRDRTIREFTPETKRLFIFVARR